MFFNILDDVTSMKKIDHCLLVCVGCHGRGAAEFHYGSSHGDADRFCRVHDPPGGCSYAGANDIHVHITEHRGRLQSA